uniref:Probable threonine--tRNA ligase, cytoplasmic n=1 Tax=Spongospora subterranea TaxID=70186 RepID=A0A0H5R706_9EUKA|eukprot:CRZ09910.1 hypothetical protein [Spongospora subterranea]
MEGTSIEPAYIAHRSKIFERLFEREQSRLKALNAPITVTLPDGKEISGTAGITTPLQIAEGIATSLAKAVIVAKVNGQLWDLTRPIEGSSTLQFLKFDDPEGQKVFWHSSAHILGEALEYWYKDGKLCIGPPIDSGGFYYDISLPEGQAIVPADYKNLETFINNNVIKEKQLFQRIVMTKQEALEMFKFNRFKIEIISEKVADGDTCTAYRCGPLIDLCRGPHIPHTGLVKAFRVHKNSSAYWKGQQDQDSLQRVYGISFQSAKELKEWETIQKLAADRDHRKIGKEQRLFFFNELSPGSCFFLPHGARIYNTLMQFMREQYWKRGYEEVITPNVYNVDLWKTSGHYQHYKEHMFSFTSDTKEFAMKPMNCPGHCLMFAHEPRSYKDLPIRFADFGVLHRNEFAGALSGLTRVRRFQQDDAHIFCRSDQIQSEVGSVLDMLKECYGIFGFKFRLALSTRPEKAMGEQALWDEAEAALKNALVSFAGDEWGYNHGDGAFYGPKIDIEVTDALKRQHQCATIQLDFQMPLHFELQYDNDTIEKPRPVIIHRAILGSVERFMAIMIEHTGGDWPFWLSPRQCIVIPLAEKFGDYASEVGRRIHDAGFFVDVDRSRLQFKKKIALAASSSSNSNAEKGAFVTRYNFILVVGAEEVENGTADVRTPSNNTGAYGKMAIEDIIAMFQQLRDTYTPNSEPIRE